MCDTIHQALREVAEEAAKVADKHHGKTAEEIRFRFAIRADADPLQEVALFECPRCGTENEIVVRPAGTWTNCEKCDGKVTNLEP